MKHIVALAIAMVGALILSATDSQARPAAPSSLQALDRAVGALLTRARVPGAALIVIERGEIVLHRNYGVTDLSTRAPVTDDTVFRAGSISKSLTAIGLMMLAEEGRLDLDAELARLLPGLEVRNPWEASDPIRLVHLVEHTAGFNDIAFRHYLLEGRDIPLSDAVDLYGPYRSRWRPGTMTSYSNAGPILAGRVIETVSGEAFADFMRRRLTGPLGMTSAYWTREPAIAARLSRSYRAGDLAEEPFMDIPGRPSGSLNVTAIDLARLPLLMLGRGTLEGVIYFTPETAARLETPVSNDGARAGLRHGYALGNVANVEGRAVFFGHDGSIDGFAATYAYSPELGAAYVLMVNSPDEAMLDAARLVRTYLEREAPLPAINPQPIREADRRAWAGQYQVLTPRRDLLAAVVGLTQWEGAAFEADAMTFKGRRWIHLGEGLFQGEGDAAPGLVMVSTPDGPRIQSGIAAHRRVPMWEMSAKLGGILLFVMALAWALIHALIWVPGVFLGRLESRGGVAPRAWPLAALVLAAAAAIGPVALVQTDDLLVLGRPSILAWIVFAVSVAAPLAAMVALAVTIRRREGHNHIAWLSALSCAVMASAACLYLGAHGWIGMRIWQA